MYQLETDNYDLQLCNKPRAAEVRAESLRLVEQLQQNLREMKIKENKIMTNTQRCDTIDSQEEYSDESPQNQIETE